MACCIFAAFLIAQCALVVRRWGRFWCVLPKEEGLDENNVLERAKIWLSKPRAKAVVCLFFSIEVIALGVWVSIDHRDHLINAVSLLFEQNAEEQIIYTTDGGAFVYTQMCTSDGQTKQILTSIY